jgi:hypothetical protein
MKCADGLRNNETAVEVQIYSQNYWVLGLCPSSEILNNWKPPRFENCACFLLQASVGACLSVDQ